MAATTKTDERTRSTTGSRSPAEIEADIVATRSRLAGTIDEISERVNPKNMLERAKAAAVAQFVDPVHGVRVERVAAVAGVVVLIAGIRIWRSRR